MSGLFVPALPPPPVRFMLHPFLPRPPPCARPLFSGVEIDPAMANSPVYIYRVADAPTINNCTKSLYIYDRQQGNCRLLICELFGCGPRGVAV